MPADGPTLDAGPFVVGLEYAAGTEAVLVGKPAPAFFELAIAELAARRDRVAVVGDDPESDIRGARAAGLLAVQVETGKGRGVAADRAAGDAGATWRVASIADLPDLIGASF